MKTHSWAWISVVSQVVLCSVLYFYSSSAWAWGERGHDLITRVAARLVFEKMNRKDSDFGQILLEKEHLLGHVSNAPDIVWRNQDQKTAKANAPTHYIDMEFVLTHKAKIPSERKKEGERKVFRDSLLQLPESMGGVKAAIRANCQSSSDRCPKGKSLKAQIAKTGHAPFRVEQLYDLLVSEFEEISRLETKLNDKDKKDSYIAAINRSLVLAGLMSHFVADLANPHHTSMNYDGWLTQQGGVHSYFESAIVSLLPLSLDGIVYQSALEQKPFQTLVASIGGEFVEKKEILDMTWLLALDSHSKLDHLNHLDRDLAVISPSQNRQPAKRKDPKVVTADFQSFIIQQLALAADALADTWLQAWKQGGKPTMREFRSYEYPYQPAFVKPLYLDKG